MSKRLASKREIRKGRGPRTDRKRLKRSYRSVQTRDLAAEDAIFMKL